MEKFKVTVASVRVFADQAIPSVDLKFTNSVKGYVQKIGDDGALCYVEDDVDHISIKRSQLTKELCQAELLIAEYYATLAEPFGQKEFGKLLFGAELTIVREAHVAGEIIPDKKDKDGNEMTYSRDCFTTNVIGIRMTDRAIARLEKALDF